MALYQNGILISGANKLPQMTYAAWQALPAAERPSEWICTDRSYSDLPASDVAYDNTDSGLSADNIQDAIDEVAQSSGGGGHTIVNPSGQSMSQENKLQFTDAGVADDSTNGKTKVSIVREMTKAQYDALSETERKGIIRITDEPDIVMGDVEDDKVEVVADGEKTWAEVFNDLYALVDMSKVTINAKIRSSNTIFIVDAIYQSSIKFVWNSIYSQKGILQEYILSSNSSLLQWYNNSYTDVSASKPANGTKIILYYGTQSAPIELTTDAEHCLMSSGESVESALSNLKGTEYRSNTMVNISAYDSNENCYVTPSEGYIRVETSGDAVFMNGAGILESSGTAISVYVHKGAKVYGKNGSSIASSLRFIPLK